VSADAKTPEMALFVSTARAFLDKHASLDQVRDLNAEDISFDPQWWVRAAELGWASLLVPEELGGGSVSGDGLEDPARRDHRLPDVGRGGGGLGGR